MKDFWIFTQGVFGTAVSAAAATKHGESRQTPRDRRAYRYRDRGRQFIFQLERGLFGKRGNRRFSPSRFCVSRGCWTRKQTGPKSYCAFMHCARQLGCYVNFFYISVFHCSPSGFDSIINNINFFCWKSTDWLVAALAFKKSAMLVAKRHEVGPFL